ncbi:hypothetical protein [Glycomyces tarimensis]
MRRSRWAGGEPDPPIGPGPLTGPWRRRPARRHTGTTEQTSHKRLAASG